MKKFASSGTQYGAVSWLGPDGDVPARRTLEHQRRSACRTGGSECDGHLGRATGMGNGSIRDTRGRVDPATEENR